VLDVVLVTDLDVYEGVGIYGRMLYEHLSDRLKMQYYYLDYDNSTVVENPTVGSSRPPHSCKSNIFKPLFWWRERKNIPPARLTHIVSENISFLYKGKRKYIVTCHNPIPLIHGDFFERLGRRYLYSGFRQAEKVIILSHFVEGLLVAKYRFHAQQLKVIPQGYDDRVFFPMDQRGCRQKLNLPLDSFIILSVAIESYRKNIAGLVKAFKIISEKLPNAILLRVGDKTEEIAGLIASLGLQEKIIYLPRGLNQSQLCEVYNASDLYACPSFYEGYVLTPLEAMACGIEVLVSNITSLEEVYGDYSIVVDPYNERDIAEKIIKAHKKEVGVNRQKVKEFVSQRSWRHTALQTYREVYQPILKSQV